MITIVRYVQLISSRSAVKSGLRVGLAKQSVLTDQHQHLKTDMRVPHESWLQMRHQGFLSGFLPLPQQSALTHVVWRYRHGFLHGHLGQQQLFHKFDIASVVERAKHQHAFEYFADDQHSSLMIYRTTQLAIEYKPAEYLSVVKCVSNRRLMSRFRTGCHGLRVDTGRWADGNHLDRTDRLCLVCIAHLPSHCIVWRTSSILCLIAQRTAISGHSI